MKGDIAVFADSIFESVKAYCGRELDHRIAQAVQDIDARVKALPAPVNGIDGQPGEKGDRGEPGADADAEAIAAAVLAKVAEVLDAIPAPKNGADGERGQDGKDADPEVIRQEVAKAVAEIPKPQDGKNVDMDEVRAMLRNEIAEIAKSVQHGRDGRDGEPGRDAFAIEVLPGIDFERRYQRGTFAQHRGGLWLARSATDGEAGWDCIVNGIANIESSQKDGNPRGIVLRLSTSNGETLQKDFSLPAMIYQQVFKEGQAYEPGDTVTWGGSLWHCNEPTTDKPGENTKAWTLAAKRGRDGKQ